MNSTTSSITDTLSSLNMNVSMHGVMFFVKVVLVVLAINMALYAFNFLRKVFFPNRNFFETPTTLHRFTHFIMNCIKLALVSALVYLDVNLVVTAVVVFIALCAIQIITDPVINAWHDKKNNPHAGL